MRPPSDANAAGTPKPNDEVTLPNFGFDRIFGWQAVRIAFVGVCGLIFGTTGATFTVLLVLAKLNAYANRLVVEALVGQWAHNGAAGCRAGRSKPMPGRFDSICLPRLPAYAGYYPGI